VQVPQSMIMPATLRAGSDTAEPTERTTRPDDVVGHLAARRATAVVSDARRTVPPCSPPAGPR
jgi:hypothetical protein